MVITDIQFFIIIRFFQGVGAVAAATLSLAVVTKHLTGAPYRLAMYTVISLISLGPAIGPTLGSFILYFLASWRFLFFFLLLGSLLCSMGLYYYLKEEPVKKAPFIKLLTTDIQALFQNYYFWGYCSLAGFGFGCFFLFLSLSPYIFVKFYQWDHLQFMLIGVGAALGMRGGSIFEKMFLVKWTAQQEIFLGFMVSLTASATIVLGGLITHIEGLMFLILASLVLFGCGLIATSAIAEAMVYARENSSAAAAVIIFIKIGLSAIISVFATMIPGYPLAVGFVFFTIILMGLITNHLLHIRKIK